MIAITQICGAIAIIVLALVADEDLGAAHADDEAVALEEGCTRPPRSILSFGADGAQD